MLACVLGRSLACMCDWLLSRRPLFAGFSSFPTSCQSLPYYRSIASEGGSSSSIDDGDGGSATDRGHCGGKGCLPPKRTADRPACLPACLFACLSACPLATAAAGAAALSKRKGHRCPLCCCCCCGCSRDTAEDCPQKELSSWQLVVPVPQPFGCFPSFALIERTSERRS